MLYFLLYLWLTHEYWVPALFLGENYEVSTHGNIRKYGKEMCQVETQYGYLKTKVQVGGVRKIYQMHRLIAEAFYGYSDMHVNHIDGRKKNNWVCNIEYCTRSENQQHAVQLGLIPSGKNDKRSKIVYKKSLDGILICQYDTARIAAKDTGLSRGNIVNACNGRVKTVGGFLWSYSVV